MTLTDVGDRTKLGHWVLEGLLPSFRLVLHCGLRLALTPPCSDHGATWSTAPCRREVAMVSFSVCHPLLWTPRTVILSSPQALCHLLDRPARVTTSMFQELLRLLLQSPYRPSEWCILLPSVDMMTSWSSGPVLMRDQYFWRNRTALLTQPRGSLPLSLSGDGVQGCILDHILEMQWLPRERNILSLCYKILKGKLYMTRKLIIVHIFLYTRVRLACLVIINEAQKQPSKEPLKHVFMGCRL